jgi:hypothetical protein
VIIGLKVKKDANKLLQLISNKFALFNGVNYGTAWNSLGAMKKHHARIKQDPRFIKFIADTAKRLKVDVAGELINVQSHANIIHAVAKLGVSAVDADGIISAMQAKGEWIVEKGNSQAIANVCWSFATLNVKAPSLFTAVDENGEYFVEKGNSQDLANMCWSLATLNIKAPSFFDAVAINGEWLVKNGEPKHVTNTCWSFATLGIQAPTFFDAVDNNGEWLAENGNPQDVAVTCWAFATLGAQAPSLFDAVSKRAQWLVENGTPQDMSITWWAFAKLGTNAPSLFDAADKRGQWLVENGSPQAVSNVCWAFATLGAQAPSLFDAVDEKAEWLIKEGNAQAITNTCWAAVTLGMLGRNDNLIRECWNAAMVIPPETLTVEDFRQLHEVELCVQIEGCEDLKSSLLSMPPDLEEAVDKAVAESKQRSSQRQAEVSSVLFNIGFDHEVEVSPFEEGGNAPYMAIDMACRVRMLAIEFNGPSHYNSDGQPNGKTMMKKRLLEKLGWELVEIHFGEWDDLEGKEEKMAYLKGMIGERASSLRMGTKNAVNLAEGSNWPVD